MSVLDTVTTLAIAHIWPSSCLLYTSVNHSIGAIPMAERKLCASVDGNICWAKIHQILPNNFSMQMRPKTVNYGRKNLGFGNGRFLQKNLGFGVGFGYRNNTRHKVASPPHRTWMVQSYSTGGANVHPIYRKPKNVCHVAMSLRCRY